MNRLIYRVLSGRLGAQLELRILMRQTANALSATAPKTSGLSSPELLKAYARFTAEEAARAIQNADNLEALHQKLYRMAYRLGSLLRKFMWPKDAQECSAIIAMLYSNIGIQMDEDAPGEFCVRKCYFSTFYTPEICAVISAIDQGVFAGVYQGGKLAFRERITEGCGMCRACFR